MRLTCCGVMATGQCNDCPYTVPTRPPLTIQQAVAPVGPVLQIGNYSLHFMRNGQVWIGHASGEGMAIAAAEVEAALARLWRERF